MRNVQPEASGVVRETFVLRSGAVGDGATGAAGAGLGAAGSVCAASRVRFTGCSGVDAARAMRHAGARDSPFVAALISESALLMLMSVWPQLYAVLRADASSCT